MSNVERTPNDAEALQRVISVFQALDDEARTRLLQTVATFYSIPLGGGAPGRRESGSPIPGGFSEDRSLSAKEFILQKQPKTDVERVACLGYFLAHYRDTPQFKTLDISKLNTEAAQVKFSNAAWAVNNAVKNGYLVPASRGLRQISAAGEVFVQALPDRGAARSAMSQVRPRRRARKITGTTTQRG